MKKILRKLKKSTVMSVVLIVGLLVSAVGGIAALVGRDKADEGYDLAKASFERGSLNDSGVYTETKGSIYTKEALEYGNGVKIKLDFDSDVSYQIFFYDENDDFVEKTGVLTKTAVSTCDEAASFRIVVTPLWSSDVEKDDQIVRAWQVNKYAKQLTVMVAPVEEAE